MYGSIDGTGSMWHPWLVTVDPETFLEATRSEIEARLLEVLAFEPNAPACVGVIVKDGQLGLAKATTMPGYRRTPRPADDAQILHDAVGAALRSPMQPGREHVVLSEHCSDSAEVRIRVVSIATTVRDVVRSVLAEPKTADERMADDLARGMHADLVGETLKECIDIADEQLDWLETAAMGGLEAQGFTVSTHGREIVRWWKEGSQRARSALRQRILLVTLLRAGRIDDARWLKNYADTAHNCVWPSPTSARNTEVLAMSAAVLGAQMPVGIDKDRELFLELKLASEHVMGPIYDLVERAGITEQRNVMVMQFLPRWRRSAFARLEVSHKLAAALCLTDVTPDIELHAPWEGWSLLLPDGLFGESQPARLWCVGIEPTHMVTSDGTVQPCDAANAGGEVALEMLRALVRSVCVVLSDPDRRKAEGKWGGGTSTPTRGKRPAGPPQEGARYMLAQPVTIDLRETVREALTGHRGGGGIPKHQFLVRGHPRQQAWGPHHSLRRYKWIEPYWKGDPEARILLRGHQMKDD